MNLLLSRRMPRFFQPERIFLLIAGSVILFAADGDTAARPFHFADFSKPLNVNLAGSARFAGNVLRLTDSVDMAAGSAWYRQKQRVTAGFDTTFQFQLTDQGGIEGADGFAFVLQNTGTSAVAGRGSAGGWGAGRGAENRRNQGIARSVVVFFDTHENREDHDPSGNYIAICTSGGPKNVRWPPPRLAFTKDLRVKLKDGRVHTARVLYRPPLISVFLDDPQTAVLVSPLDLSLVADSGGAAWIGFTASTGAGYENHDILNWAFNVADVSSTMDVVSSNISFFLDKCLPGKTLCTPSRAIVEQPEPVRWHIVLPANIPWAASIPNTGGRETVVKDAQGSVCWDVKSAIGAVCSGPEGKGTAAAGQDFLVRDKPARSLVMRRRAGRTEFSVNGHAGSGPNDDEGYFEFDVELKPR